MASPAASPDSHDDTARCLACGVRIEGPLAALGSLRCADCRSARRMLDEALVRRLTRPPGPQPGRL